MSTFLEALAKADVPNWGAAIAKALDDGVISTLDADAILKTRASRFRHGDEKLEKVYVRSFVGPNATDAQGAAVFQKCVFLDGIGKGDTGEALARKPSTLVTGVRSPELLGDSDTLEGLVRQHMEQHPEVTSKTLAYHAVLKTPRGRELLARDTERSRSANAA